MFTLKQVLNDLKQKKKNPLKTLIEVEKKLRELRILCLQNNSDDLVNHIFLYDVERELDYIRTILTVFEVPDSEFKQLHLPPAWEVPTYEDNENLKRQIEKYHDWCVDSIRILQENKTTKRKPSKWHPKVDARLKYLDEHTKLTDEEKAMKLTNEYGKKFTAGALRRRRNDLKKT